MEKRENMRGLILRRALERHPNQQARPVLMFPQLDKLSNAWLLALPGPFSGLSSPVFSEGMCSLLCLPSPACKGRVGETVRRGVMVDMWGDKVMSAPLPGDTWRTRHDEVKFSINSLCAWSKLPVTCEVFNLFAHLIPQEALNRMERGKRRQAILPDFRLAMPDPVTGISRRLAELKVITCCSSRYQVRDRQKALDRRAGLLMSEYRKKAKKCRPGGHRGGRRSRWAYREKALRVWRSPRACSGSLGRRLRGPAHPCPGAGTVQGGLSGQGEGQACLGQRALDSCGAGEEEA